MKKWLVGLVCVGMMATAALGQVASLPTTWSGPWTNANLPSGWSQSGLGTDYAGTGGLGYDSTGGGAAKFDTTGDTLTINFDSSPGTVSYWIVRNGSTTENLSFVVEESADGTSYSPVASYVYGDLPTSAATGGRTNALNAAARYVRFNYVLKASGCNVGIDGVLITAGSTDFLVSFDKAEGFKVTEGTSDAIVATALNGTEPYGYGWSSTLDGAHYSAVADTFTILATAPAGSYSATVVATDDAAQSASNTINFSVETAYAIAIAPPTNGIVTTDPENQALAGETVAITATPAGGYRVASIAVADDAMNPVAVVGNAFTMPAAAVTVTVTFEPYEAPDQLIDFETVTGFNSYAPGTSTVSGVLMAHSGALRGTSASDPKNGAASARIRYLSTNVGFIATAEALAQPITKINFLYADYGSDNTTTFKVQVSADGASWQDVGAAAYDPDGATLLEGTIDSIPANMTYFQFLALGGEADRVCIDDIGLWFGAASFGVTFDQPEGFQIEQGTSDVITATAANGTEPYGYSWSSSLDGAYYSALDNVFTILATAPLGDYSAQVVATDATAAAVTNTINFSVTAPVVQYGIAIVTNAPENGTVTTTPATEAAEGATVTVSATPVGGYAVQSIAVVDEAMNPVTVTGNAFTMPASAVTVTVTFQEVVASGALIISQYYEGAGFDKWIEIYNPGSSTVDLAAGGYRLGTWNNTAREGWKTNGTPTLTVVLSNSLAPGATYLISTATASNPTYAVAQQTANLQFNGDDSVAIFTGTPFESANVVDAFGLTANTAVDKSFVRKDTVTAGIAADFNAADWDEFTLAQVEEAGETTNERLGYHSTGAPVFGVSFDKTSGFTVEQGTSDAITATAANGTAPYDYVWTSSLGEGDRTAVGNVFTILATAPLGDYSATVVATDASDPVQSVTNSLNFSVVAPATKYAITIVTNAPENGTVTTTPSTEAEAGQTVTVNAVPVGGYRVASLVVNGGAVAVTGNTFTMPAEPAAVTVTFEVYDAPGVLIDFETNTTLSTSAYTAGTSLVNNISFAHQRVLRGNLANDRVHGVYAGRFYPQGGTSAVLATTAAFAEPITKISLWHANYGTDNGTTFKVQVSPDGATWEDVGAAIDPESTTLTEVVLETVPANATYLQIVSVSGTTRINIDDIGLWFGTPAFSVSVNRTNGFTVAQGASDAITATAVNGTAPYGYSWTSTLGEGYRTAADNVFTILATAPAGDYTATVTATDDAAQTASNTVSFTVLAGGGGEIWQIGDGSLGSAMFYTTSNQNVVIVLPTNYLLTAVYGTDSSPAGLNNLGQGLGSTLTQGVDYDWNPATRTISILSGVTNRRVLRIGATPE